MGKPIIRAHFMGREIKLENLDVRGRVSSGTGIGSFSKGYETDALYGAVNSGGGIGACAKGATLPLAHSKVSSGEAIGSHAVGKTTSEAAARADSGIGIGDCAKGYATTAVNASPAGGEGIGSRAKGYDTVSENGKAVTGDGIGSRAEGYTISLHVNGKALSGGGIGCRAVGAVTSVEYGRVSAGLGIGFAGEGMPEETTVPTEVEFRPSSANQSVTVYFSQSAPGAVRIDWGDGVSSISGDTLAYTTLSHTYSGLRTYQNYTLRIYCKDGETWEPNTGNSTGYYGFINRSQGTSTLVRTVYIGDGVTVIGPRAFAKWNELFSVYLPDTITTIGADAFEYDRKTVLNGLPSSLTNIGAGAFAMLGVYVTAEKELIIPEGVTTLYNNTFSGAHVSLHIPASISGLIYNGRYPFYNGNSAYGYWAGTKITASLNSGTYIAKNNCLISKSNAPTNPSTLVIRARNAVLPDDGSITAIREYSLNEYTDITIPASVTSIGATNITKRWGTHTMTLLPTTPPTLSGAIINTGTFTYLVPAASVEAYKAAPYWSAVADKIQAIS